MPSREEKLASNEVLFRNVNERIAELTDSWGGDLDAVCECADMTCHKVLRIRRDDYERLRQDPRRFAVLPGHEVPEIENVVEQRAAYLVVEKHVELMSSTPGG